MDKEGTAPGSSLTRYSFRMNLDISARDWLRFGTNLALSFDERSTAHTQGNSVYNAAFMSLLSLPYETPYNEDGSEKEMISGYFNPNYMIKNHPQVGKNLQINGSAYIQITPIRNLNILIIDDEADNASINSKRDDNDPTQINRKIRELFTSFKVATYVGFTATPFANIFIDPMLEQTAAGEEGIDLYPRHFIVPSPLM